MKSAELVLESKKIKRHSKNYQVYYKGQQISGYKGKRSWTSYNVARSAIINILTTSQFLMLEDGTWGHITAFKNRDEAERYVDEQIVLRNIEIKEVK